MKKIVLVLFIVGVLIAGFLSFVISWEIADVTGYEINIMSFNVRNDNIADSGVRDWNIRDSYVFKHISENNPDVVCLQEVKRTQFRDFQNSLLKTEYGMYYAPRDDSSNPEGVAILYKKGLYDVLNETMFWLSETPDVMSKSWHEMYYRVAANVTLKVKQTGEVLNVFSTHLDLDSANRRKKEMNVILQKIDQADDSYRTIVCGDFNEMAGGEAYNEIGKTMQDCQAEAKNTDSGVTYQNFGGAYTMNSAIDFCFVSKSFYVKNFEILNEHKVDGEDEIYYSDHYAIKMKILIPDSNVLCLFGKEI